MIEAIETFSALGPHAEIVGGSRAVRVTPTRWRHVAHWTAHSPRRYVSEVSGVVFNVYVENRFVADYRDYDKALRRSLKEAR